MNIPRQKLDISNLSSFTKFLNKIYGQQKKKKWIDILYKIMDIVRKKLDILNFQNSLTKNLLTKCCS